MERTESGQRSNLVSSAKPELLLLCHRVPFPADKGDKIRSFNLLRELSFDFNIHLAALTETKQEQAYDAPLKKWCYSVKLVHLPRLKRFFQLIPAILTNTTITNAWFYSGELKQWVNALRQKHPDLLVLVYCSSMAQYVLSEPWGKHYKVIDFVDVDSEKWFEYAKNSCGVKKWLFQREAILLSGAEQHIFKVMQKSYFVSAEECQRFAANESDKAHLDFYLNGVDLNYYNPTAGVKTNPYDIIFTGVMSYPPNVNAVLWFVEHCWPDICAQIPDARLWIVGSHPVKTILKLHSKTIRVTGTVPDIRPYFSQSALAIAPMRSGGGIKNKVLEAMAMTKPLVISSVASRGLDLPADPALVIVDSPEETIAACVKLLMNPIPAINLRKWVESHANWSKTTYPVRMALLNRELS